MKDIFLLWHLIIKLATLKGGDDQGASSNESSATEDDFNAPMDQDFSATASGQSAGMEDSDEGMSDLDSKLDAIDNLSKDATIQELTKGTHSLTSANYDEKSNTVYGFDSKSAWSVTYDKKGNISSAFGSINDKVEGFTNGVSSSYESTFYGSKITSTGYTTTTYNQKSFDITNNFLTVRNIGSFSLNTSLFGDVTAYNKDIGTYEFSVLGSLSYQLSNDLKTSFTVDLTSSILSLGFSFLSVPASMSILSNFSKLTTVGKIAGAISVLDNFANIINQTQKVSSLAYGAGFISKDQLTNTALSSYSQDMLGYGSLNLSDNGASGLSLMNRVATNAIEKSTVNQNIEDRLNLLLNLNIYEHMAGGIIFNEVFAGGEIFDAITPPFVSFSIGDKFTLSGNAKRISQPYEDLAGGKFY